MHERGKCGQDILIVGMPRSELNEGEIWCCGKIFRVTEEVLGLNKITVL